MEEYNSSNGKSIMDHNFAWSANKRLLIECELKHLIKSFVHFPYNRSGIPSLRNRIIRPPFEHPPLLFWEIFHPQPLRQKPPLSFSLPQKEPTRPSGPKTHTNLSFSLSSTTNPSDDRIPRSFSGAVERHFHSRTPCHPNRRQTSKVSPPDWPEGLRTDGGWQGPHLPDRPGLLQTILCVLPTPFPAIRELLPIPPFTKNFPFTSFVVRDMSCEAPVIFYSSNPLQWMSSEFFLESGLVKRKRTCLREWKPSLLFLGFSYFDVEKCVLECRGWDVKRDRGCGEIRWQASTSWITCCLLLFILIGLRHRFVLK